MERGLPYSSSQRDIKRLPLGWKIPLGPVSISGA